MHTEHTLRTKQFKMSQHGMACFGGTCTTADRVYDVSKDDGEGVYFVDNRGLRQYAFDKHIEFVSCVATVQNPDSDVPVAPAPNPAVDHPAHYGGAGNPY